MNEQYMVAPIHTIVETLVYAISPTCKHFSLIKLGRTKYLFLVLCILASWFEEWYSWLHAGTGKSRNLQPPPDHHLPNSSCWVGTCPYQWVQSPPMKELNPTASCSSTVDILAICCGKKCHECSGEGFLACFTCEGKAISYSSPDANHTATSRPPSPENTLHVEWAHDDFTGVQPTPMKKLNPTASRSSTVDLRLNWNTVKSMKLLPTKGR